MLEVNEITGRIIVRTYSEIVVFVKEMLKVLGIEFMQVTAQEWCYGFGNAIITTNYNDWCPEEPVCGESTVLISLCAAEEELGNFLYTQTFKFERKE